MPDSTNNFLTNEDVLLTVSKLSGPNQNADDEVRNVVEYSKSSTVASDFRKTKDGLQTSDQDPKDPEEREYKVRVQSHEVRTFQCYTSVFERDESGRTVSTGQGS